MPSTAPWLSAERGDRGGIAARAVTGHWNPASARKRRGESLSSIAGGKGSFRKTAA